MKDNANNKILLTIAIPTYNKVACLENLLNNILSQVAELEENIEICISDNNSPDNTQKVVAKFKENHPNLINYNRNKENLGAEKNMLLVIEMSKGEFVWLFGDDDLIVPNGLKDVINFIKNNCKENTALVTLREKSFFIDEETGKKIIYYDSLEANKPLVFRITREDIVDANFPSCTFMTVLIFKNNFLKELLKQEKQLIEKAVGNEYIPMFLFQLMFLRFSDIEAITFNKHIISQELSHQKFYIEDRFKWHYVFKRKLNELLLSSGYADDFTAKRLNKKNRRFRRDIVQNIILMKTFKTFFYHSYFGIFKKFFLQSTVKDGLMFSFVFLISSLVPPFILQRIIKIYFFLKYGKEWKNHWTFCYVAHCKVAQLPE